MARMDELIRKVRVEMDGKPESEVKAAISELRRREAVREMGGISKRVVATEARTWKDALLETATGRTLVQAKLDAERAAEARIEASKAIGERIRQLKALVHDVFVVQPRIAEPVDGWRPRVRFDIYDRSKETCRKLGQAGGSEYNRVVTAVKYAGTGSKAWKEAVEALGL